MPKNKRPVRRYLSRNPNFIVRQLDEPSAFNIEAPDLLLDAHLREEDGIWILDVFDSQVQDANRAHLQSIDLGGALDLTEIFNTLRDIALRP